MAYAAFYQPKWQLSATPQSIFSISIKRREAENIHLNVIIGTNILLHLSIRKQPASP